MGRLSGVAAKIIARFRMVFTRYCTRLSERFNRNRGRMDSHRSRSTAMDNSRGDAHSYGGYSYAGAQNSVYHLHADLHLSSNSSRLAAQQASSAKSAGIRGAIESD